MTNKDLPVSVVVTALLVAGAPLPNMNGALPKVNVLTGVAATAVAEGAAPLTMVMEPLPSDKVLVPMPAVTAAFETLLAFEKL